MATTSPDDRFEQILDDAWRLVSFSARTGRDWPNLMNAWTNAEQEFNATSTLNVSLHPLLHEMSLCVKNIAPIRLKDLGSKWTPFESDRLNNVYFYFGALELLLKNLSERIFQGLFVFLCVLVVMGCGYYSLSYLLIRDNISHLVELNNSDIVGKADKFYVYYPDMTVDSVRIQHPPDNIRADSFLAKSEELKDLDSQIRTYVQDGTNLLYRSSNDPFIYYIHNIEGLFHGKTIAVSGLPNIIKNCSDDSTYSQMLPDKPARPADCARGISSRPAGRIPTSSVSDMENTKSDRKPVDQVAVNNSPEIKHEETEAAYFRLAGYNYVANSLSQITAAEPTVILILHREEQVIEEYSMFHLPVLFGMLGTIVFHVRGMATNSVGKLAYWRVGLRVFLGGLAGAGSSVILSNLGSSSNPNPISDGGLLFLAFILGFSLDLFFRILDRAVEVVSKWFALSDAQELRSQRAPPTRDIKSLQT